MKTVTTLACCALWGCIPSDPADRSEGPPPVDLALLPLQVDCAAGAVLASTGQRFDTLDEAFGAAASGDVIAACPGTHRGPFHAAVPVTLGGVGEAILDAGGRGAVLTVPGGTRVLDLVLTGGRGEAGGGLSVSSPGEIVLARVTLEGNRAVVGGGLALPPGTSAALHAVRIAGNQADEGGGIWLDGAELTATGTEIAHNVAELGGAVACTGGAVELDDSRLSANEAHHGGGAFADGCSLQGGSLIGNVARGDGGGAVLIRSHAIGVDVRDNRAVYGGGLYAMGSEVDASVVARNVADVGDGIFAISGLVMRGTRILDHAGVGLEIGIDQVEILSGAVLRNGIGAASDGRLAQVLSSSGTDWGTADSDNTHDVTWGFDVFAFGADATFTCRSGTCGG